MESPGPTFGAHFLDFCEKVVLPCKNEHFMVSEASRPAAHG